MSTKMTAAVLSVALVLSVGGCDIPDHSPGASSKVALRHCDRAIGSLVCADGTPDGAVSSVGDPNVSQTFFGAKGR